MSNWSGLRVNLSIVPLAAPVLRNLLFTTTISTENSFGCSSAQLLQVYVVSLLGHTSIYWPGMHSTVFVYVFFADPCA